MDIQEIRGLIAQRAEEFEEISDAVWEFAETCFEEHRSSRLQREYMEKEGFRVISPVCGMDTAFIAEYGAGHPVIAFLGENDALPGQSQQADLARKEPLIKGGSGHACGHNLLGTGSMEAVCAVKRYMERHPVPGTIRYYACPAEEGGGGKVFLAKGGAFDGVDAGVTWHPGSTNQISNGGIACVTAEFHFTGKASHASGHPWMGRSALDAVELMNTGIQYLREHMLPTSRIHYAITNAGGDAPNVVQAEAEVLYVVRCKENAELADLFHRVCQVAEGAALMTGTTNEAPRILSAYANRIPCDAMDDLMIRWMRRFLPIEYTKEELDYAARFVPFGWRAEAEVPIDDGFSDCKTEEIMGSTDLADVSWLIPLGECNTACCGIGTSGHTWMFTAQGKSSVAHKGMHTAAGVMAAAALELLTVPETLAAAKKDHQERIKGRQYTSLMPKREG